MGEGGQGTLLDPPKGAVSNTGSRMTAGLLLGQLLSLLLAAAGLFSSLLAAKGVSLPAAQTLPNYFLLALLYGSAVCLRRRQPHNGVLSYAAVSLFDVQGNFLVVLAYRFTYITSVQLLNSFTIPCVLVLSWALLSARYSWRHCAGAALCVASLGLLVATDVSQPNQAGSQMKPAAGDAIVLAGAALYALSNVAQEKLLRRGTVVEVLAFLGAFGLLWAGLQSAALELGQLRALHWTRELGTLLAGYTAALFAFYSLVPAVLQWSGAAALNLSLLTANIWAAVARTLFLGGFPQSSAVAFGGALLLVTLGLLLYTWGGSVYPTTPSSEDCYWVIRPGQQQGQHRGGVQTPRLSSPKAQQGASVGIDGSAMLDHNCSRGLRTWLSAAGRPGRGLAGAADESVDVEAGASSARADATASEDHGGGQFWMRPLATDELLDEALSSLPNEGAQGTDPYTRVSESAQRNNSAPPTRSV